MFRIRTLLFGLLFGILDALCLPIVKSVSIGTLAPAMMLIPVILYGASPLIFLKGLQGETLTILNLVWDLTSDVVVTLIGLFVFAEQISSVKKIGVLLSFVSLFLMTYEGDGISEAIDSNIAKIRGALGFKQ
jgi:drug/metabolite transporter (DMT)-like permease